YASLPSRAWINEHLSFTHGFGPVAGPVNRIAPEGLPDLFVQDIPPAVKGGMPKITRPEIYYGELSNEYAIVRTKSQELNYPAGDQNVYTKYEGRGGVPVGGALRKLAFALRFGEIKILLSDDISAESRVMFYRRVGERVRQVASFLRFDHDPYLVITDDGRLVWIVDGYTVTDRYPSAQPAGPITSRRNSTAPTTCRTRRSSTTRRISGTSRACSRTGATGRSSRTSPSCGCPERSGRSSCCCRASTRRGATT